MKNDNGPLGWVLLGLLIASSDKDRNHRYVGRYLISTLRTVFNLHLYFT